MIISSAPGRADFLNTHQDYKGLPVVPVALNLRTYISAKLQNKKFFTIKSLDLEAEGKICVDKFKVEKAEILKKGWFGNYFRGIVNLIVEQGLGDRLHGMQVFVKSQIPIGSGLGSSAALEVAFAKLLNHACNLGYTDKELAELAYVAEREKVSVPCGRLDQYSAVFGGIIKLSCRPPFDIETIGLENLFFVVLDSGIRRATANIHPIRQMEINKGLKVLMESEEVPHNLKSKLGYRYDEPKWEEISEADIKPYLSLMGDRESKRILFTLRMQKSTERAFELLKEKTIDYISLGKVMNEQHEFLRDLYEVSLPELERIRNAALKAGAYGVKISGAGLGGCLIALVKDEVVGSNVLKKGLLAGARQGWVLNIDEGARIESA